MLSRAIEIEASNLAARNAYYSVDVAFNEVEIGYRCDLSKPNYARRKHVAHPYSISGHDRPFV